MAQDQPGAVSRLPIGQALITAADFICIPYTPDLTEGGISYACRSLLATPVVSIVAILSLALGIGANTALFSIVNAIMLRSLPVRDADRLVIVGTTGESLHLGDHVQRLVRAFRRGTDLPGPHVRFEPERRLPLAERLVGPPGRDRRQQAPDDRQRHEQGGVDRAVDQGRGEQLVVRERPVVAETNPLGGRQQVRSLERQHGRVVNLPPGGRWQCTWSLEVQDSASGVAEILKRIGEGHLKMQHCPSGRLRAIKAVALVV